MRRNCPSILAAVMHVMNKGRYVKYIFLGFFLGIAVGVCIAVPIASDFIQTELYLPETVEEFVEWSQQRQYRSLELALIPLKRKFPACGGAILWMGHDCYPLPTNCSLIDFDRNLKPAAEVVKKVFTSAPEDL